MIQTISIIILFILIVFTIASKIFIKNKSNIPTQTTHLPYQKKEFLLTKTERLFFDVLELIFKEHNYYIFTKVRLADLIYILNNTENKTSYLNKIISKHVDFLICDKSNIKPCLAIELDDPSHKQEKRIKRDNFINEVLNTAKLPILHIPAEYTYNTNELSSKIFNIITKEITGNTQ